MKDYRTQTLTLFLFLFCQFALNAQSSQPSATDYGVITISVSNIRDTCNFSSEMVTQAIQGTPVKLLKHDNWYKIQTPDGYVGWVHRVAVQPMDSLTLSAWNRADKVIVTAHYGFAYQKPDINSTPVSDIVAGNRFKLISSSKKYFKVGYPDGRVGYIRKTDAVTEQQWRKTLKQDTESILATANSFMGIPYLWAGMSSKGVDCSGFVRAVLYMHDIIIPRDASQQAKVGEYLDIANDFSNLLPGDLIFFGRKASETQKLGVSHVGIYIGNGEFVHSQGDVHISSLVPGTINFDQFNLNRLLFATRVTPFVDKVKEINTTKTNSFYCF